MKYTSCFILAMMVGASFTKAQKLDTLRRKDVDGMEFFQVKRNGLAITEGYLLKGANEGTWVNYWETNGFPNIITNYRNSKLNGIRMQINQQGYTESIENYKDDLLDGPKRVYQSGTQFLTEEINYKEGRKHGLYKRNYSNGKVQEESNYKNGERDGKATWYFETGDKTAEYHYKNGAIDGEVAFYFKNGKVSEFGLYANGEQNGNWKEFFESGAMKAEGKYINGKKEGAWKEYDESGKVVKTRIYKNGETK